VNESLSDNILLTTVWHSGTHTAADMLKDQGRVSASHCNPAAVRQALSGNYRVITTYRDPLRIAASWRNRGRFITYPNTWFEQWECWAQIVPIAEIVHMSDLGKKLGSYHDRYDLHEYLDNEQMGLFSSFVPQKFTDFALSIVDSVSSYLAERPKTTGEQ
jgi:hypothetical protein